jgi:hypothetical protein
MRAQIYVYENTTQQISKLAFIWEDNIILISQIGQWKPKRQT